MTLTDLAAVVGALAWLPPIIVGLRSWLTKPQLRVITQPTPEIGYTTLGPILNLRLALTVTHRDMVVTGIRLQVRHESGEEMLFSWQGIVQRMGTMTYPQIGAVPFEKESNVLAIKVSLKDIEERFVRFQNLDYLEKKAELEGIAAKRLSFLKQSEGFDPKAFLRSQEMSELYSFIRQSFSWKPGSYRVRFLLESPGSFSLLDDEYAFTLSPLHAQRLADNLDLVDLSYAAPYAVPAEGESAIEIQWGWVYPDMRKLSG